MDKLKMHTPDFTDKNIDQLATLFPNCVTEITDEEGNLKKAIDFDLLKQELSNHIVEGQQERYQLNWPGKREALLAANAPIAKTLRPCREESVNFDETENLFIEGDNLDALKLLQETYLGKVKMIYIDPPYNTGKDFIYNDKFKKAADEYFLESDQVDEEGNRMETNLESKGRFHSDWLSMMYSRLKLARNLLRDDGVIFISIDDNEVHNLRKICDEVFGIDNFISEFARITKKAGKTTDRIAKNNDYLVCYMKSEKLLFNSYLYKDESYKNTDEYMENRGKYKLTQTLDYSSIQYSPSLDYEITIDNHILRPGNVSHDEMIERQNRNPKSDFCWRWSKELFNFGYENGFIVLKKGKNGKRIYTKTYEKAIISKGSNGYYIEYKDRTKSATTLTFIDNKFSNDNSRKDIAKIFDEKVFEYSKPTSIIRELLFLGTSPNDIILDFFAGSATTAHAVMQLNAEDGGSRKFIMVQLPEACDEKSEAFKAGYTTIAEISKERIRRAGKKILDELESARPDQPDESNLFEGAGEDSHTEKGQRTLDTGFRVLKVDSSNMAVTYYTPDAMEQEELNFTTDNIKADRSTEDLLFQVLLDWGVDLTYPIKREIVAGLEVFFVNDDGLAACFVKDGEISEDFCKELAQKKPRRVVFRDAGFKDDSVRINVEQIFKLLSPSTEVRCI